MKHLQQEAVSARSDAEKAEMRAQGLEKELEVMQVEYSVLNLTLILTLILTLTLTLTLIGGDARGLSRFEGEASFGRI